MGLCRLSGCSNSNLLGNCPACPVNYVYNFGFCISSSKENCFFYENGKCLECAPGFYLAESGLCLEAIDKCLISYPDTGRC